MKILYLASSGRSGSTLLGSVLGQLPGFFNVGELRWFWAVAGQERARCGCGAGVRDCVFWSGVIADLQADAVDLRATAALASRLTGTVSVPRILTRRWQPRMARQWREYAAASHRLYRAVDRRCDGAFIVDGSKLATQLLLHRELPDADVRALHLVRDGRAVAHSWEKRRQSRRRIEGTALARLTHRTVYHDLLTWMVQNALLHRLARPLRYRTVMRYEDFATDPEAALERALTALGIEPRLDVLISTAFTFQPTHALAGSDRVRFADTTTQIVLDDAWRRELPPTTIRGLSILGSLSLLGYAYPIRQNRLR